MVITLRKAVFMLSKQPGIYNRGLHVPHVRKSTLERLEKGKQEFVTGLKFIDNTSANRNTSNLNARNTCGKGEFKVFPFFKLHFQ